MNRVCIYHGGCPDGFTAAWAAKQAYPDAELVPGYYGAPPPDVGGCDVLIVDFSYPRPVLIEMEMVASRLRVYDHHKTAEADLEGLSFCVFDMERSGAGLAWDELVGGERPWLIDYVEDRDLWRFALPDSKAVAAWVMAQPYSLDGWDALSLASLASVGVSGKQCLSPATKKSHWA